MNQFGEISFENLIAGMAHMAMGLSQEEVLKIIGVELPDWDHANKEMTDFVSKGTPQGSQLLMRQNEIYLKPAVGAFKDLAGIPEVNESSVMPFDKYVKLTAHMAAAEKFGHDSRALLQDEYEETNYRLVQAAAFWGKAMMYNPKIASKFSAFSKFEKKFSKEYGQTTGGLADDINF